MSFLLSSASMKTRSAFFTVIAFSVFATSAYAQTQTHSVLFQSLDQDSPARQAFIQSHNQSTKQSLEASSNYIPTQNLVYQYASGVHTLKQQKLDATRTIKLIDRGLHQSTDLVLSTVGQADVVLTSNFEIFGVEIADSIVDFNLSPNLDYLYLVFAHDGSIDQVTVRIYDFANRVLLPTVLTLSEKALEWTSPTTILYESELSPVYQFSQFDLTTNTSEVVPGTYLISGNLGFDLLDTASGHSLLDRKTGNSTQILGARPLSIIDLDDHFVYVTKTSATGDMELRTFNRYPTTSDEGTLLLSAPGFHALSITATPDSFLMTARNGPDRTIRIYNRNAVMDLELLLPSCCAFSSFAWVDPTTRTQLKINFSSAVVPNGSFIYDLTTKTWDQDPNVAMMTAGGINYISTIEYLKCA